MRRFQWICCCVVVTLLLRCCCRFPTGVRPFGDFCAFIQKKKSIASTTPPTVFMGVVVAWLLRCCCVVVALLLRCCWRSPTGVRGFGDSFVAKSKQTSTSSTTLTHRVYGRARECRHSAPALEHGFVMEISAWGLDAPPKKDLKFQMATLPSQRKLHEV